MGITALAQDFDFSQEAHSLKMKLLPSEDPILSSSSALSRLLVNGGVVAFSNRDDIDRDFPFGDFIHEPIAGTSKLDLVVAGKP